jgi:recombination protein U
MFANRGMYIEEIINRTIDYYINHYDCLLEKRNIPIKIVKDLDNNMIVGKLLSKSYVDYSGYINNHHLEFESKQTNNKHFSISLIKDHQYSYLIKVQRLNCLAFVIVYFSLYDCFYLLPVY